MLGLICAALIGAAILNQRFLAALTTFFGCLKCPAPLVLDAITLWCPLDFPTRLGSHRQLLQSTPGHQRISIAKELTDGRRQGNGGDANTIRSFAQRLEFIQDQLTWVIQRLLGHAVVIL
ncbi:hypothetical protein AWC27_27470 [Mycobacterium szulgai]|uniref:Uncharacterized protein n=1 Tax=Mycobacterium szulgai TaxID=1787 RepID=A0A1X2EK16_MYCSZ|nr:hypothetical protein AWC27_27470 [Mycobacterium szulgai]